MKVGNNKTFFFDELMFFIDEIADISCELNEYIIFDILRCKILLVSYIRIYGHSEKLKTCISIILVQFYMRTLHSLWLCRQ